MTNPHWLRVNPPIRQLILGEVERQYHPIGTEEYRERVEWMTDAWIWAQEQYASMWPLPSMEHVIHLAQMVEPVVNRQVSVQVGDHVAPSPDRVPERMVRLWEEWIEEVQPVEGRGSRLAGPTADDFYLEFQAIHPFRDGNGRTGKILHNWLLGTLGEPVLIFDYFGGGNP